MKKFKKQLFSGILFLLILFVLITPQPTFGLSAGGIGILPANPDPDNLQTKSWFIYTMDRGGSKEDAVSIFNNSDDEVVVKVYPVDATTTEDGNFTLVDEFADQLSIGAWVRLYGTSTTSPTLEVGLKAHDIKKIPFTINVPDNADVGDHMGGLIVQEISRGPAGVKKEGMTMSIVTRIGARIYLTVPGEKIENLEITNFGYYFISRHSGFIRDLLNLNYFTNFFLTLKNGGNVRIEPNTTIVIKNIFGQKVDEINGKVGIVFPKRSSTINLSWQKPMFLGRYSVEAQVKYSENQPIVTKNLVFWVVPYRLLTILGGLIVLLVLLRLVYLYLKEIAKEKMMIYTLTKKESIQEVAEKFKVNWSKLARINNLKKPYELKKDQKLFIPGNRRNRELLATLLERGIMEPSIEEKLGRKQKSFLYKIHHGKKSLKILFIAIIILIIGGGATWLFFTNAKKQAQQQKDEIQIVSSVPENAIDDSRTRGGELKRSEIKLAVSQNASSGENVDNLIKKLRFVGFQVEEIPYEGLSKYTKTTFEYNKDKYEAAKAVQTALGIKDDDISLVERQNLNYDVIIAYFIGDIFDLVIPEVTPLDRRMLEPFATSTNANVNTNTNSSGNSINKEEVTISVLNGGAVAGSASQAVTLIKNAGYSLATSGNADNFNYQGVTIYYTENYATVATEMKTLLSNNYPNITLEEKTSLPVNVQIILGS